jgi:uncharacterized protein
MADQVYRASGQSGLNRVWMPDYILKHLKTGREFHLEILGFWRKSSLEELLQWVPQIPGVQPLWAVSDKWKVDEEKRHDFLLDRVVTFRDIPNATDILNTIERLMSNGLD